mgnify:CR=1 FL=1
MDKEKAKNALQLAMIVIEALVAIVDKLGRKDKE